MARKKTGDTREKLLTAAGCLFMEQGYRDTTVAEICRRAGANISAVNYYFGGKESLYQEAWRHAFAESIKTHPQDGGVSPEAPATERLRGRLKALVERIADDNSKDFFISQREFVNPTGLLEEVMKSEFNPLREKTLALVRELLGPQATEQQVVFCETCLLSLCLHPMLLQRLHRRTKQLAAPIVIDDLDAFTDQVMTFGLAGVAAIRQQL